MARRIKLGQFRIHFEWPRPADQAYPKVVYIGPKEDGFTSPNKLGNCCRAGIGPFYGLVTMPSSAREDHGTGHRRIFNAAGPTS
jgi:hypothetical protein